MEFHLYRGGLFYWRRKPEYPEITTDPSHVIDKLYHIMLYRVHPTWAGFEPTILVAIGTDYTDSCKSNYHVITTTTTPIYWTCSQPEYSWNTVRWTSNNNQSINLMISLLNCPRFIMFVIISQTLTRPACHCFALQGLGYFVPTKNLPWLLKQSFCFTFQMRVYNIFFNNRCEHH